jgi:hypothetical protein
MRSLPELDELSTTEVDDLIARLLGDHLDLMAVIGRVCRYRLHRGEDEIWPSDS